MIELGTPTILALGPGIISIFVVIGTFAAAGMYAIGRRNGWDASQRNASGHILKLISNKGLDELRVNNPTPSLLKALDYEIIRRRKDND